MSPGRGEEGESDDEATIEVILPEGGVLRMTATHDVGPTERGEASLITAEIRYQARLL